MKADHETHASRVGVVHFESFQAAIDYYRDMFHPWTSRAVSTMLAEGAIAMGKPHIKDGQHLHMDPNERRYYVVDAPVVTATKGEEWRNLESELMLTLYMPDGFGIGWDYEIRHQHPAGHDLHYEYSHTERRNHAADLMVRLGCCEYQIGIFSEVVWVRFKIKDPCEVETIKRKVQEVLNMFKRQEE